MDEEISESQPSDPPKKNVDLVKESQERWKSLARNQKWTQSKCVNWRPSVEATCFIVCLWVMFLICIIFAVLAMVDNEKIYRSEVVQYDVYTGEKPDAADGADGRVCAMSDPTSDECNPEKSERLLSANDCALTWNGYADQVDQGDWGKECEFYIKIEQDVKAPIYVYYQIDHVFQNHREYVKSRSFKMEQGKLSVKNSNDCSPMRFVPCEPIDPSDKAFCVNDKDKPLEGEDCLAKSDKCKGGKVMVPCGNAAYSTFNDRFQATLIRDDGLGAPELKDGAALTAVPFSDIYNAADTEVKENYDTMRGDTAVADLNTYKLCCGDDQIRSFPFGLGQGAGGWTPGSSGLVANTDPPASPGDVPAKMFASNFWSKKNIAWPSDVAEKYTYAAWDHTQFTDQGPLQVSQSQKAVKRCEDNCGQNPATPKKCPFADDDAARCKQLTVTLPRMDDHDFIVWMRYATTQDFSKLHRVINFDLKKGDLIKIKAMNYFQLPTHGRKKLFLSTAEFVGGKGSALAMLWIFDAGLCAFIAVVFWIAHCRQHKKNEKAIDTILFKAQKKMR